MVTSTPHRVIVVEDDPSVVESIREELGSRFEVVAAPSYTPALNLLYERPRPAAVIAHLGTQDGYGGAQFMVEVKRILPAVSRVLYSSWNGARDLARDFADEFLLRPWPTGELRTSIVRLLGENLYLDRMPLNLARSQD